jgi:hypothetical protein
LRLAQASKHLGGLLMDDGRSTVGMFGAPLSLSQAFAGGRRDGCRIAGQT